MGLEFESRLIEISLLHRLPFLTMHSDPFEPSEIWLLNRTASESLTSDVLLPTSQPPKGSENRRYFALTKEVGIGEWAAFRLKHYGL